jgi:hypothetical protein
MASQGTLLAPDFGCVTIQGERTDGYWVETFHLDQRDPVPGVVCSGLVSGLVEILDNPIAEAEAKERAEAEEKQKAEDPESDKKRIQKKDKRLDEELKIETLKKLKEKYHPSYIEKDWTRYQVGKFDTPVAVIAHDVTGNGLMDLIICHNYGPFMLDVKTSGGHVSWLENPGRKNLGKQELWKQHYIGRWPSMHRLRAGYFTQRAFLEVVAAPIVHGPHDKATPVPILLFTAPDNVLEATEWPRAVIDDRSFTCIHEVAPRKLNGPHGLESLVVSSREGVTIMSYDTTTQRWVHDRIGVGEPQAPHQTADSESPGSGDYWGTGSADIGKIGNDPFAYIATLDPFHGVAACVYTKEETPIDGRIAWKRHVLDVYGTPNQRLMTGDGPGHYITCGDFDGDGDDEFVLSLYGPLDRDEKGDSKSPPEGPHPYKGIMYYKAIDLQKGIFAKWRVSDRSSARVALGDFAGTGCLDIVSMKYNVVRYYEEPKPDVTLHRNNFAPRATAVEKPAIFPTLWDKEGMVYIIDPSIADNAVTSPSVAHLIEVANYAITVEVYPPSKEVQLPETDGFKVLFGAVVLTNPTDKTKVVETRSPYSVKPFTATTTKAPSGVHAHAHDTLGAVLLRFHPLESPSNSGPFRTASDVPVKTTLPLPPPLASPLPSLEFKRVDSLWWGEPFKDMDFYNLTGFHFYFVSPNPSPAAPSGHTRLAHIQFWTAGKGVNCGVHNHSQDSFCEVHVALSPGTGNGSMARLKPEYAAKHKPEEYNSLKNDAFDWLPMAELDEHGGFWGCNETGRPVRSTALPDTVHYPWHKWQAGDKDDGVDVWMAIEFNPDMVDCAVELGQEIGGAESVPVSQRVVARPKKTSHCC